MKTRKRRKRKGGRRGRRERKVISVKTRWAKQLSASPGSVFSISPGGDEVKGGTGVNQAC